MLHRSEGKERRHLGVGRGQRDGYEFNVQVLPIQRRHFGLGREQRDGYGRHVRHQLRLHR